MNCREHSQLTRHTKDRTKTIPEAMNITANLDEEKGRSLIWPRHSQFLNRLQMQNEINMNSTAWHTGPHIKRATKQLLLLVIRYDLATHYIAQTKVIAPTNTKTVYQATYMNQLQLNQERIRNPDRTHAVTKLLYVPDSTGISIKNLIQGDAKLTYNTSYTFDYRNQKTLLMEDRPRAKDGLWKTSPAPSSAEQRYHEWKSRQ